MALRSDGSILGWGDNGDGQCNVPHPNSGFAAMSGGGLHSVGLKADSTIVGWGYDNWGQCQVPEPNQGFLAQDCGGKHTLALRCGGSVEAFGYDNWGQCQVPEPNTGFVAVSGGAFHSIGLRVDPSGVLHGQAGSGITAVPNPFGSVITLELSPGFAEGSVVSVYDLSGRVVAVLSPLSGHSVYVWNGAGVDGLRRAKGVYFVRAVCGRLSATVRVIML